MMPDHRPAREKNLDGYGFAPLEWARVTEALDKTSELETTDAAGRFWLATTRSRWTAAPDGGGHRLGRRQVLLQSGAGTQKSKNLARDPHCVVSVAAPEIDVVAEGEAQVIRDEAELRQIAKLFSGWGPQVRDGAFWHEYSAPSAGPPPWDVR